MVRSNKFRTGERVSVDKRTVIYEYGSDSNLTFTVFCIESDKGLNDLYLYIESWTRKSVEYTGTPVIYSFLYVFTHTTRECCGDKPISSSQN